MGPETTELLIGMLPDEWDIAEETLRLRLRELEGDGLVSATLGWYGDETTGEHVRAVWWTLTERGRARFEPG